MKGHNTRFLTGAKAYLQSVAVECYPNNAGALTNALKSTGYSAQSKEVDAVLELDFVPVGKSGTYVSLKILGPVGTYARTGRYGKPVPAAWLPYTGQASSPDPSKFGRIKPADVGGNWDYIATVNLTGCTIVAVQEKDGFYFYHEPTQEEWGKLPDYDGDVLARVSPDYTRCVSGFAVIRKLGGNKWRVMVQDIIGTTPSGYKEVDVQA